MGFGQSKAWDDMIIMFERFAWVMSGLHQISKSSYFVQKHDFPKALLKVSVRKLNPNVGT